MLMRSHVFQGIAAPCDAAKTNCRSFGPGLGSVCDCKPVMTHIADTEDTECEDINECDANVMRHQCSIGNAACTNNVGFVDDDLGGYTSTCNEGDLGDGVTLVDIDECFLVPTTLMLLLLVSTMRWFHLRL